MMEHPSAFLELGEVYHFLELKNMAEKELLSQLEKKNMVEMVALENATGQKTSLKQLGR